MQTQGEDPSEAEAELLAALREGDRLAFEALYRRYAPWLAARLQYRCADAAQLDDVVQDTFLAVWRCCASGKQPEVRNMAGWLWRIASRRLADASRSGGARERLRQALAQLRGQSAPSAEDQVLTDVAYGELHAALGNLSPDLREVVQATVLDGLTTRQAAQRLNVPAGTVKTRAMRARQRLRRELARGAGAREAEGGQE
ncbi:RNA polymerase sigma factor [Streptomyces boncukensis]|uniref:RNA polymerase sigma factor n=1 Tax=Streptomyces boncukensis TaxID=2711219 RepID=A0A6G4WYH0_9ACTN|nr:RNA polymerase sigma factor [Streptomyces boncukensis]NGO70158.1 RNA polymerase sigma factor [Streptomyces boncukensis]